MTRVVRRVEDPFCLPAHDELEILQRPSGCGPTAVGVRRLCGKISDRGNGGG